MIFFFSFIPNSTKIRISTNNGALYNLGTIKQLSEKLIEQFEARIAEKESIIQKLRNKLEKLT